MTNTVQLIKKGQPIYPVTYASLVIGLNKGGLFKSIFAWDGESIPSIANIPEGVSVIYEASTYTGTLSPSADEVGIVYLVANGNGEFDKYIIDATDGSYRWKKAGTTTITSPYIVDDLITDDSEKALSASQGVVLNGKIDQLGQEVHNLSGKYYGLFTSSAALPSEITQPGYAFIGSSTPFSIWNFDGSAWTDTGATVDAIHGKDGVGFQSVASQQDGTIVITLTNGDTVTIDLNHQHQQYLEKTAETTQPLDGMLPDIVYKFGTLTGEQTFTFAPTVTGNVNHYFFSFISGASKVLPTWPSSISQWSGNCVDGTTGLPVILPNKTYEVSVIDGNAFITEW